MAGKQTRVEQVAAVQRKAAGGAQSADDGQTTGAVDAAARGMVGPGHALPHLAKAKPDATAKKLASLANGTDVRIIGKVNTEWLAIEHSNATAFVQVIDIAT